MNRPPLRDTPAAPLVFFTGGTALRALSRHLAAHAVPAVHIVTTFDSGGSTAVLRRAFAMPAVGDIRHRLGALADPAVVPPRVLDIWEWRMPQEGDPGQLRDELRALGEAWHAFWLDVPERFAAPLRRYYCDFLAHMPADFDPHGACFGNLVIAGGFLRHDRRLDPILLCQLEAYLQKFCLSFQQGLIFLRNAVFHRRRLQSQRLPIIFLFLIFHGYTGPDRF